MNLPDLERRIDAARKVGNAFVMVPIDDVEEMIATRTMVPIDDVEEMIAIATEQPSEPLPPEAGEILEEEFTKLKAERDHFRTAWAEAQVKLDVMAEPLPNQEMDGIPWTCDICGAPGRKANGPEGYCDAHWPILRSDGPPYDAATATGMYDLDEGF